MVVLKIEDDVNSSYCKGNLFHLYSFVSECLFIMSLKTLCLPISQEIQKIKDEYKTCMYDIDSYFELGSVYILCSLILKLTRFNSQTILRLQTGPGERLR